MTTWEFQWEAERIARTCTRDPALLDGFLSIWNLLRPTAAPDSDSPSNSRVTGPASTPQAAGKQGARCRSSEAEPSQGTRPLEAVTRSVALRFCLGVYAIPTLYRLVTAAGKETCSNARERQRSLQARSCFRPLTLAKSLLE